MADTVGNLLGERGTFRYETDNGDEFNYNQDRSVGLAVGNALSTSGDRPISVSTKYLRGRYILVQAENDPRIKKRIIVASTSQPIWSQTGSTEVIINGRVFVTTGKVGEAVSFLRLTPLITPPAG